ncbi:proline dehydrogenase family protein [Streptacidiphilus jiangxiensis]|uniref:proline dehydrogenase n=1 Tax=Streptacidiphilus jiangxiensis TaxID=235985 RepID=A0A1H7L8G1_STRJI|nr:proline dehydrogenase family protein [Streptacidiphilus jiangxiensis]SEK95144.1 proline dehydrogenase [Streptacidiphilus jiangxiensis]
MLRSTLLAASRSPRSRKLIEQLPPTRAIVNRFVAGETLADGVTVTEQLVGTGRRITLDHLGEDTADASQAAATAEAYEKLLAALAEAGLADRAEVSVKLSAVGQFLPQDGEKVALENARRICEAAAAVGTTVTLDMEDHTTTDSTLGIARDLRADYPWLGVVLQAYLHRTEADCREFSGPGSRVRLCKGAYQEPASVAFQKKSEVDLSYVRCLKILMAGQGYPMIASHDPRLIRIAGELAAANGREADSFEYQMLFGIRPEEQERLIAEGNTMRVYLPYGNEWYGYFMRRLAERPANLTFFLRALATKS